MAMMSESFLCLAILLVAVTTPALTATSAQLAELGSNFGIRVFQEVVRSSGDQNVVLSPHGVAALMGMAQLGAAGNTLRQLEGVMRYRLNDNGVPLALRQLRKDLIAKSNQDAAYVASSVFVQRDMQLPAAYMKKYRKTFNSWPKQLFFQDNAKATYIINKWVEVKTQGMIHDFLHPGLLDPALTRMVLLNAIFFRGLWKMPFPTEGTQLREFYKADGTRIMVPMMSQIAKVNAGEFVTPSGMDYDVIELPYHDETFSMYIAAPYQKRDPLSSLTNVVDIQLVNEWKMKMHLVKRQVALPKFSLETEINLEKPLENMGIKDMFKSAEANFSNMSKTNKLFVAQALQKVKIEANESGTKASAATAAIIYERMAPLEVAFDRPFLFLIRHNPTGTILFMGQVMEP
ncbi:plasminogen activator inhibitor 1 [Mobula hypostoma]|uniref:plasminogen activator inhibitor 1 n=1 Tax=Mobula hypostoma TaxID=723540 RepID=UPI002FC2EB8F